MRTIKATGLLANKIVELINEEIRLLNPEQTIELPVWSVTIEIEECVGSEISEESVKLKLRRTDDDFQTLDLPESD